MKLHEIIYNQDLGPKPALIQLLWRKKLKTDTDWGVRNVGASYQGKLSTGTYEAGQMEIRVQRVYDDVWRGEPLLWTRSDQRRRYPNDSGLDRADKVRRDINPPAWQA